MKSPLEILVELLIFAKPDYKLVSRLCQVEYKVKEDLSGFYLQVNRLIVNVIKSLFEKPDRSRQRLLSGYIDPQLRVYNPRICSFLGYLTENLSRISRTNFGFI